MRNLNRHWAYEEFREARAAARREGIAFTGFVAAAYLKRYSQMGERYTHMVKSTIKRHQWNLLDLPRSAPELEIGREMAMLSTKITAPAVNF